jgi:hypothetical protein
VCFGGNTRPHPAKWLASHFLGKGILLLQCFCGMQQQFQRHSSGSLWQFDLRVHVELLGGIVICGLKCVSALHGIQYIATSPPRVESCVVRDVKT